MWESHRDRRPDVSRGSVAASLTLHLAVGTVFVAAASPLFTPQPPPSYRVKLVAAAPEEAPEREQPSPAPPVEETPRPEPEELEPVQEPEPEPVPEVREEEEEAPPEEEPARSEEQEGADPLNVELEGASFPFPGYLENIIRQVHRYWRPPSGNRSLRAELSFVIHADGSVTGIEWIERSGDAVFDLTARGAIEAAGRNRAFGSLPEGYPRDRLRVSFFFDPTVR